MSGNRRMIAILTAAGAVTFGLYLATLDGSKIDARVIAILLSAAALLLLIWSIAKSARAG